ncbi:hypothetical protein TRFO_14944 [Tritrichomonas foetus]|uniref:Saposin B-type domain-containing protein n=1 Tax=Tritrichomonas foetus TaxID=1144522 RepID=A0A1J4KTL7_9EUKA|nr:hypothetical protein TRFO_14944 [Tritrichomonas foetus]|eukprot:OHT14641.1 hypothetical protein TRFO_14944 [Tritrichomonas foetus]
MNLRNKQVLNAPVVKGEEDVDECKYCLDTTDIVVKYYGTETQEFILEQEAAYCDSLGGGDPTGVCYFFIAYLSELQYSYVEQGKTSIEICYDLMKVCE